MREIKFRVWDKEQKEMAYVSQILFFPKTLNGDFMQVEPLFGNWLLVPSKAVLMQYTGLKDKNGVEIYEGAIIDATKTPPGYRKGVEFYRHTVEWLEADGFYFVSEEPYNCYTHLGDVELLGDIVVIGDINQNPELLEDK